MVGLLRFRGLLVGLWARGRGCQQVSDGREDVEVVFPAVGWSARPVRGSGGGVLRSGVRQGGRRVRVVACSLCRSVSRGP